VRNNQIIDSGADDLRIDDPPGDYRDLVIAQLADDEIDALDAAATWRAIARAAMHELHERDRELTRLREQRDRLLGEYRALRESEMRKATRAA
jgi:hypothetical protein